MPVYEYACSDCGAVNEAIRKMSDADAALPCDRCGSPHTRRKHSVFTADDGGSRKDFALPTSGGGGCGCGNPHGPCNTPG